MSFENEKLSFLKDLGVTPNSIPDEPSFEAISEDPGLQGEIESLVLSAMKALGYKWKKDAVFLYDDAELVEAMHRLLNRQNDGAQDVMEEKSLRVFNDANADLPPGEYAEPMPLFQEIAQAHFSDFMEGAGWVRQHPYSTGKREDAELNQFSYDLIHDVMEPAQIIARKLHLRRQNAKPNDVEINLMEAKQNGWVVSAPSLQPPLESRESEEEYPEQEEQTASPESDAPLPLPCKGLTPARKKSFLKDLGMTPETVGDEETYDALLHSHGVEAALMLTIEVAINMLGYKIPDNFSLDFTNKETTQAVHTLLQAPFDCVERERDHEISSIIAECQEEAREIPDASLLASFPDNSAEDSRLAITAGWILESVADFHINALDHVLNSVINDIPRSMVHDDALHDLAVTGKVHEAVESLARQGQLEKDMAADIPPVAEILARSAEHGMLQLDRRRGVTPEDKKFLEGGGSQRGAAL